MGISPQNIPVAGSIPFTATAWDPARRLSWDEILRLPGNNILKNLYWANRRWEAQRAHVAVMMQHQANLANEQSMQPEEASRRRPLMDKTDIFGDGRDAEEVLLEMGIDPSSGPIEELAEEARAKRAVDLIYAPDKESYSFVDQLLQSLSRSLYLLDAMKNPLDPSKADTFKNLMEKILDQLYRAMPSVTLQNWLMAQYYAFHLAKGLVAMGHADFPGDPAIYVKDFANHVERLSRMANQARRAVEASDAPDISPSFFEGPRTFVMPTRGPDQSEEDWMHEVALKFVQSQCPHVTTERTMPNEQKQAIEMQQLRSSPFNLKPEAPAPQPSAKDKLEHIATEVLMVPAETLETRLIYGAMHSLGEVSFSPEQAGSDIELEDVASHEKKKSPSPFSPPRPPGFEDKK